MIPTATTKLYGLIGTPIDHSFSPKMHNTAFEKTGVDGCYLAFDTRLEDLEDTVKALVALDARGWNVTMPLKTAMADLCDELSREAKLIGAVNTVVNDNGKLTGYSTDGVGFFANAKDNGFDPQEKSLVLIGAGGAARSIAAQALFEGIKELIVYNRTLENAERLVEELKEEAGRQNVKIEAKALSNEDALKKDLEKADLMINATSVGMNPKSGGLIINPDWLRPDLLVADIVYTPVQTLLDKEAKNHGCETLDGLGMVLWQGAYSFEYWTGQKFPVGYVKEMVFDK